MKQQDIDSLTSISQAADPARSKASRQPPRRRVAKNAAAPDRRFLCIRRLLDDVRDKTDADAIASALSRAVVEQMQFEDCSVYLFNATDGVYEQRSTHGPENPTGQQMLIPIRVTPGQGLIGSVALTAQSELIYGDDETTDTPSNQRDQNDRCASRLVVPIVFNDRVVGVIDSQDHKRRFHTEDHRQALEAIAEIVAMHLSVDENRKRLMQTLDGLELARDALSVDEAHYSFGHEDHPSMFLVVDALGAIKLANGHLASYLGYVDGELNGRTLADLCPGPADASIIDYLSDSLRASESTPPVEQLLMARDGLPVAMSLQARIINFEGDLDAVLLLVEPALANTNSVSARHRDTQSAPQRDRLTGLFDAEYFESVLYQHVDSVLSGIDGTDQSGCHAVVGYINVDQLGSINDSYGQSIGDELLAQLADLMAHRVRRTDTLARLTGDRFALLMRGCTLEDACRVSEGLRTAISDFSFASGRRTFKSSVSIGLCAVTTEHDNAANPKLCLEKSLLDCARQASDDARQSGGNRIRIYNATDSSRSRPDAVAATTDWTQCVSDALDEDAVRLFMQPIKSAQSPDTILGLEVHVRIDASDGDSSVTSNEPLAAVSSQRAARFLPAVANDEIMVKLDRWVIEQVLDWYAHHGEQLMQGVMVSVNVAGHSLADDDFRQFFLDALDQAQLGQGSLCVELRESDAPLTMPYVSEFIGALRSRGVRVAIDAVGAHLRSITQWRDCPVDYAKLDASLVQTSTSSDVDLAVLMSVCSISQLQETVVIAGYVEDEKMLEAVVHAGVDGVQGYHIATPVPMHAIFDHQPGLRRSRHSAEIHAFPR